MSVTTYSKKTQGELALSTNFKVKEFACKDGSDAVLIDSALVEKLQQIRSHFGVPVTVNSGYRTAAHNAKVGGAVNSQHIYGKAADFVAAGKDPLDVAKYAESIGCGGIGYYPADRFVHVDVRSGKACWVNRSDGKGDVVVATHGGAAAAQTVGTYQVPTATLRRGSKGDGVKWLQTALNTRGYGLAVDGGFGAKTESAVRHFQAARGLAVDGVAGPKTKAKLSD